MQGEALFDVRGLIFKRPQRDVDDGHWRRWIAFPSLGITAVPVTDDGYDLQSLDGLAGHAKQPSVEVQLVVPVGLLIHHRPCACDFIVADDDPIFVDFLQVDGTRDLPAIELHEYTLLYDVVVVFAVLQDVVDG